MILVVGATGFLGSLVVQALRERGHAVRALVRPSSDVNRVASIVRCGASVVTGDLRDPHSLRSACDGATHVITTASAIVSRQLGDNLENVDGAGTLALCDEAERAGVRQLIHVSFQPHRIDFPLQTAKRTVEARLRAGSLPYTILQPSFFAEVWLSPALLPACGIDVMARQACILGNGFNRNAWVSVHDVVRVILGCMNNPLARGQTFELGGPEALDWLSIVRMFEHETRCSFSVRQTPEQELSVLFQQADDAYSKTFSGLMLSCSLGYEPDNSRVLAAVPIELSSVQSYVSQTLRLISCSNQAS